MQKGNPYGTIKGSVKEKKSAFKVNQRVLYKGKEGVIKNSIWSEEDKLFDYDILIEGRIIGIPESKINPRWWEKKKRKREMSVEKKGGKFRMMKFSCTGYLCERDIKEFKHFIEKAAEKRNVRDFEWK